MSGNVWEWVNDFYDAGQYFAIPTANPPGPESGAMHSARGGSWVDKLDRVRAALHARDAQQRPWFPLRLVHGSLSASAPAELPPRGAAEKRGTAAVTMLSLQSGRMRARVNCPRLAF